MRLFLLLGISLWISGIALAGEVDQLVKDAKEAFGRNKVDDALRLLDRALAIDSKNVEAYRTRAEVYEAVAKYSEAADDWTKVIALDKNRASAYQQRGFVHFKAGKFKESIADFDEYIERVPKAKNSHWQRGISYYYAGQYEDGRKQFEGYQDFDKNDVENAVWHYLCSARFEGVEKARAGLLKIGKDRRVPLMEVYALYAGKAKPEDVLKAARAGDPSEAELKGRLFYAHLYLGLYYEAEGDKVKAREHIGKAADDYNVGHYMGDVARVGHKLLSESDKK